MSDLPVTIYTPESPVKHPVRLIRALGRDLSAARELAWRLFVRDLSAQYRQTFLGYIWAFLPPLVASLTFIYLNSQGIIRIEGTGIPYPAFVMIGTLVWQIFVDGIQCPLTAINSGRAMLAKINFPREALLMAGLYMVLFNAAIRLMMVALVMSIWKVMPGPGIVIFPVAVVSLLAAGFAVGLVILPLGSLYGDISRGIPIIAQFWMLLTPVVYPPRTEGLAGILTTWNPVAPLVATAREALCNQDLTLMVPFAIVTCVSILLVFLGLLAFRLVMPLIIERMGG